jgi:4-amino-4-deoxy-L-arabinose transferase-like glycosyltransferase
MRRFLLPAILFLAFFLRTWQIGKLPVGFTPDEASLGYDAYSILKTGKDQWGSSFPLVLKSFGDFKSPFYAYLTMPSVAVFGLNKFAVRLPNAILGTLVVLVVYLLVKELTKKQNLAIIAALLLTVSSWHVMLSRGAFEANLITFFLPLGIYLFLKGKYNLSALVFGLNLFSYHSAKLITPIIFVVLFLIFKVKKLVPIILFSGAFLLMLYSFNLGAGARVTERSVTQGALEEGAKIKIELIKKGMNPVLARVLHNKYQVTISRFVNNYFQYFSFRFLFTQGPAETTYGMLPGYGVLYGFEEILLLGLIPLVLKKKLRTTILLIAGWLFVSAVPAALATGVGYSANRAVAMIPSLQILEVLGAVGWGYVLAKLNKKVLAVIVFFLAFWIVGDLARYAKAYFFNSPKIASAGMLSENLAAAAWLKDNAGGRQIIVSRTLSEPQIYIAFANEWDPALYQKETANWQLESWVDQIPVYKLGNYTFKNIDWKTDSLVKNTLLVGKPSEFPADIVPLKTFFYSDGSPAILICEK